MTRRHVRTAAVMAAILIVPAIAGAAMLHLKLLRSEPVANATLSTSPTQVSLWFSQKPELSVTSIKVKSGLGTAPVERVLAPISRAAANGAPMVAPLGAPLGTGHYEIVWRTMARDGHVLSGTIPFDVGAPR